MILKTYIPLFESYEDKFMELYNLAPDELKRYVDSTKNVDQNPLHHPEKDAYDHIKMVTNRLWKHTGDMDLTLAGFFHDLGKGVPGVTVPHPKKTEPVEVEGELRNFYTAPEHEKHSANIVDEFNEFIESLGGNPEKVRSIVLNHMKISNYLEGNMRRAGKIAKLESDPYFDDYKTFAAQDRGGYDI